jgi:hypothetical protein
LTVAVPAVVLMARAGTKNSDYAAQNGKLPEATLESKRSDVNKANLIADVFLGATVASLAATGILYFSRPSRPHERGTSASWIVVPSVENAGEGAGARVLGRF